MDKGPRAFSAVNAAVQELELAGLRRHVEYLSSRRSVTLVPLESIRRSEMMTVLIRIDSARRPA